MLTVENIVGTEARSRADRCVSTLLMPVTEFTNGLKNQRPQTIEDRQRREQLESQFDVLYHTMLEIQTEQEMTKLVHGLLLTAQVTQDLKAQVYAQGSKLQEVEQSVGEVSRSTARMVRDALIEGKEPPSPPPDDDGEAFTDAPEIF